MTIQTTTETTIMDLIFLFHQLANLAGLFTTILTMSGTKHEKILNPVIEPQVNTKRFRHRRNIQSVLSNSNQWGRLCRLGKLP